MVRPGGSVAPLERCPEEAGGGGTSGVVPGQAQQTAAEEGKGSRPHMHAEGRRPLGVSAAVPMSPLPVYVEKTRCPDAGDSELSGWSLPTDVTAVGVATEEDDGDGRRDGETEGRYNKGAGPTSRLERDTNDLNLSQPLVASVFVAGLVFVLAGIEATATEVTYETMSRNFGISCHEHDGFAGCALQHLFVVCFPVGLAAGSLFGGLLCDTWGRRCVFVLADLLAVLGSVLIAAANSYAMVLAGRSSLGAGIGTGCVAYGAYVAEVSPFESRGALLVLSHIFAIIGSLSAYAVGSSVQANAWRYMGGILAGLAGAQLILLVFFVPESPRWLIQKGKPAKALHALVALGAGEGQAGDIIVQQERRTPAQVTRQAHHYCQESCSLLVLHHGWQFLAALGCALAAVSVGSSFGLPLYGFNTAQTVLCDTRLTNVATWTARGLGAIIAFILVDSWGRRPLLLVGTGTGAAAFTVMMLGFIWHARVREVAGSFNPCSESAAAAGFLPPGVLVGLGLLFAVLGQDLGWSSLLLGVVAEMAPTCLRGLIVGFTMFLLSSLDVVVRLLVNDAFFKVEPSAMCGVCAILSAGAFCFTLTVIPEGRECFLDTLSPDGHAPAWLTGCCICKRRQAGNGAHPTGESRRRGEGDKRTVTGETGIEMQSQSDDSSPTISREACAMQMERISDAESLRRDIEEAVLGWHG